MKDMPNNLGLLEQKEFSTKDWFAGGVSGVDREVLREDGDYRDFLPEYESQIGIYFDTMGCVTFSALNVIETIAKVKGITLNRSDRFTAKMSGTTKRGNYLSKVADSIAKNHGTVEEESWPYPRRQRTPVFDWDDFYSEIPEEIVMEGRRSLKKFKVQHEWVPTSQVREYLKYSPLQVTVQSFREKNANGYYINRPVNTAYGHAVELVYAGDDYCEIYDHYDNKHKRLAPDYKFGHAKLFTFSLINPKDIKPTPMITLPNNCLVQMVGEGANGAFALHLDGKLLIDETEKVLASWSIRSSSFENKKALTKEQWDSFPHFNLKNEPLK